MKIPPRAPTEPIAVIDYEDRTNPGSEIVQVARIATRPAVPAERPLAAPVGVRKQPTQPLPTIAPPPAAVVAPIPVAVIPPKQERPATSPPTIIPIPKLPSIKDRQSQIQPVVSSASARPSRTRFAKGTGPVSGTYVGVAPPPPIRPAEDDDKTSPGLPAIARALPSIKRLSPR